MKKAVLFDVDGVLLDSMSMHFEAWDAAFASTSFNPSREDYAKLGGMPATQTVRWFNKTYDLGFSEDEMDELAKRKHVEEYKRSDQVTVFDGVTDIFTLLKKRGVQIDIVTGMSKAHASKFLSTLFSDPFTHITGYGDYELGKPHPDPFLMGWKKTGFKKSECILVEDSPLGIRSGVSAGIDSIGITSTVSRDVLEEAGATYVVGNHDELLTLLFKLTT